MSTGGTTDVSREQQVSWIHPPHTLILLGCVVVWLIVFSCGDWAYRRKRNPAAFCNPLGWYAGSGGWHQSTFRALASFVTGQPVLAFLVGLSIPVALSVEGARRAEWGAKFKVDMDFKNYVREETPIRFTQDAFEGAINEQKVTMTENEIGRRLRTHRKQSQKFWRLDIYFGAKDPSTGVFTVDAMREIKAFQDEVKGQTGYTDHCALEYDEYDTTVIKGCYEPSFFMDWMAKEDISGEIGRWPADGTSSAEYLQEVRLALNALETSEPRADWWLDKDYDAVNFVGAYSRTQFRGGIPLNGDFNYGDKLTADTEAHKEWLVTLYNEVLTKAADKYTHITINWSEKSFLQEYETLEILVHDLYWSAGSIGAVVLLIYLQTRRLIVSFLVLLCVVLSFSTTYYFYFVVLDYEKMTVLNFVSVFLVIGKHCFIWGSLLVKICTHDLQTWCSNPKKT
jgi:hypothetical protein